MVLTMIAGDQLQDKSRQWLSPEDPSTNYNIARKAYHDGSATWFIQGTTFGEWEVNGSLLWIHGKRRFIPIFHHLPSITVIMSYSGLRKEHPLVRTPPVLLVFIRSHAK